MEELTREELDYLYEKSKKNNIKDTMKSHMSLTTTELMVLVGLFLFLWDRIIKFN